MKRLLTLFVVLVALLGFTTDSWAPMGIPIPTWRAYPDGWVAPVLPSSTNVAIGGTGPGAPARIDTTGKFHSNNSSIFDSGGQAGFANSGGSWTAFGSGSSSIAGTNISISGDTISVVDPPTFDSANIGALGVSVVTFQDAFHWTDPGNAPNPAIVGMISYSAQSSWRTTVGQYYFVSGPSNWQIIDWFHPLAGTNISYSGDTFSVINNPSFSSTTTLAGATVMSGEAGTAGWYVKLDGSGNVSLGDPSGGTVNSFVNWAYGGTTISADSPTDTVTLIEGSNISFAMSPAADSLTITASGGGAPLAGTNISVSGQTVSMVANLADAYVADDHTLATTTDVSVTNANPTITLSDTTAGDDDWQFFANSDTFIMRQWISDTTWTRRFEVGGNLIYRDSSGVAQFQVGSAGIVSNGAWEADAIIGTYIDESSMDAALLGGTIGSGQVSADFFLESEAAAHAGSTSVHHTATVDTDTTYNAGDGVGLSGTTFSATASTHITVNVNGISVNVTTLESALTAENLGNSGSTASWVLATDGAGDSYWKVDATGGGGANSFETWNMENGTDPVADSATDTILIYDGAGITVTGDATADSITIAYSGAFSGVSGSIATAQVPTDITIDNRTVAQGGTGATTLLDGGVLLGSGIGTVTPMAVLADSAMIVGDGTTDPVAESGATLRTSIGVGTGDTPQLTGIEVGHATDTSLTRKSASVLQVEANELYVQGGTDVADADVVDDLTVTSTKAISTTSTINGLVNVTSTTAATLVLTATTCASDLHINGDNDAIDYTLPTAVAGQNCGFYTPFDAIMTVDTANTGDSIILGGTTLTAGNAVDSASSAGSYAYFMAISASQWSIIGEIKTWVDGGAD